MTPRLLLTPLLLAVSTLLPAYADAPRKARVIVLLHEDAADARGASGEALPRRRSRSPMRRSPPAPSSNACT